MNYKEDLKEIICKCSNEDEAVKQIKELTAKKNIVDALDDEDLGVSIED